MSDIAKLFRKICGENIATKERVFYSCSRIYKWFLANLDNRQNKHWTEPKYTYGVAITSVSK